MEPSPDGEPAIHAASDSVVVDVRRLDEVPTGSILRALDQPRFCWDTPDGRVLAGGEVVSLATNGPERFERVREAAGTLFDSLEAPPDAPSAARPRLVGGFAFHEGHDGTADGIWHGFPGCLFVLPAVQVVGTDDGTWLTAAASGPNAERAVAERLDRWTARFEALPGHSSREPPNVRHAEPTPDRREWRRQVESVLSDIEAGRLRKVVLAGSLSVDLTDELVAPNVLARLDETYPDCVRFLVEPPTGNPFFGATPERLVSLRGESIQTTVLAGSIGRGETAAEDDRLARDLEEGANYGREHEVVLEAMCEKLAPLTSTVRTGERGVRKLATLQHLETPVSASLGGDHHVLDLVEALHPTPAVGGMPQDAALRAIRSHEAFERGWYAAPIGWFDAEGDGSFAVAIRSALARGSAATLFAGNGIVADSDPDCEWDELRLKYRSILDELA